MNNITLQPEATLTVLAEGFRFEGGIAPILLAPVRSETIYGYFGRTAGEYLRIVDTLKKGNGSKNVVTYKVDRNKQYEVQDHELENEVTVGEAEKFGGWDTAKRMINAFLSMQMSVCEENSLSSVLTSAATLTRGQALAGANQWNDSTSKVLSVIKTAKDSIAGYVGVGANNVTLSYPVFSALQFHPEIYSVLGANYKGAFGLLNEAAFAAAFGVDRVLVAKAIYNTAKEGQTASLDYLWGKTCIVSYIAPSSTSEMDPGLGARITCPAKLPEVSVGSYTPEGNDPGKLIMLKQNRAYSNTLVKTDAAYLIRTAVA
jgi:hypothetical protein